MTILISKSSRRSMAAAYKRGATVQALADEFGLTPYVVRKALVQAGVTIRSAGRPQAFTPAAKKRIRRRYEKGESAADLAAEFGVSAATIGNVVVEMGGTMRAPGHMPGRAPRGEDVANAVITEDDVLAMRRAYAAGEAGYAELGKRFGITGEAARLAITGQRWSHVPGAVPKGSFKQGQRRAGSPGRKRLLDAADDAKVAERYAEGATIAEIASELNVSTTTVAHSLERSGVERRSAGERIAAGFANPGRKLAAEDVRAVRSEYAAGGVLMKDLAARYGVTTAAIGHVISRRSWAHIPD